MTPVFGGSGRHLFFKKKLIAAYKDIILSKYISMKQKPRLNIQKKKKQNKVKVNGVIMK